jgi:hypothetical protein
VKDRHESPYQLLAGPAIARFARSRSLRNPSDLGRHRRNCTEFQHFTDAVAYTLDYYFNRCIDPDPVAKNRVLSDLRRARQLLLTAEKLPHIKTETLRYAEPDSLAAHDRRSVLLAVRIDQALVDSVDGELFPMLLRQLAPTRTSWYSGTLILPCPAWVPSRVRLDHRHALMRIADVELDGESRETREAFLSLWSPHEEGSPFASAPVALRAAKDLLS